MVGLFFSFLFLHFVLFVCPQENIKNALSGMRALGMEDRDLFDTIDLYDGKNMRYVNIAHENTFERAIRKEE